MRYGHSRYLSDASFRHLILVHLAVIIPCYFRYSHTLENRSASLLAKPAAGFVADAETGAGAGALLLCIGAEGAGGRGAE